MFSGFIVIERWARHSSKESYLRSCGSTLCVVRVTHESSYRENGESTSKTHLRFVIICFQTSNSPFFSPVRSSVSLACFTPQSSYVRKLDATLVSRLIAQPSFLISTFHRSQDSRPDTFDVGAHFSSSNKAVSDGARSCRRATTIKKS